MTKNKLIRVPLGMVPQVEALLDENREKRREERVKNRQKEMILAKLESARSRMIELEKLEKKLVEELEITATTEIN
jgi:hypothetical protein